MAVEDNDRSEVDRTINIRLYNYPESMIALKNSNLRRRWNENK